MRFWKVYFHGGAFIFAGASIADGYFLLEHEVVLVSVDYRQGPFGFLSLNTSEVSGNQGLRDQQLALRWVSENIGQFGGNPDKVLHYGTKIHFVDYIIDVLRFFSNCLKITQKVSFYNIYNVYRIFEWFSNNVDLGRSIFQVTIFGQSAGSWSVTHHLVAPGSKNLFSQAIAQLSLAEVRFNFDMFFPIHVLIEKCPQEFHNRYSFNWFTIYSNWKRKVWDCLSCSMEQHKVSFFNI